MEQLVFARKTDNLVRQKNSKEVVEALVQEKLIPRWDGEIPAYLLSKETLAAFHKFREQTQNITPQVK